MSGGAPYLASARRAGKAPSDARSAQILFRRVHSDGDGPRGAVNASRGFARLRQP